MEIKANGRTFTVTDKGPLTEAEQKLVEGVKGVPAAEAAIIGSKAVCISRVRQNLDAIAAELGTDHTNVMVQAILARP